MQEAGRKLVAPAGRDQRRIDPVAGFEALRTAGVETTTGGHVGGVGKLAAEQLSPAAAARGRHRHSVDQRLRVGMLRALDHVGREPALDHPPEVHDRDPVAQRPGEAEVVGDEQQRQLAPALQLDQHGDDLRPHRGIEHRHRLVADQPLGLEHERRGDRHALALAARELMRVTVEEALGVEAGIGERALDPIRAQLRLHPLDEQGLVDDRRDLLARVERLVGVLEDHLHPAAQLAAAALALDLGAVEAHRPADRGLEPEQRPRQGRFATTRLADDAEDLAAPPLERDPVERPGDAPAGAELDLQVPGLEQRGRHSTIASLSGVSTAGHSLQGAK